MEQSSLSAHLTFLQSPVSAVSGEVFALPVVVAIDDQNGALIGTDYSSVTLTISGGPGNTSTVLTSRQ